MAVHTSPLFHSLLGVNIFSFILPRGVIFRLNSSGRRGSLAGGGGVSPFALAAAEAQQVTTDHHFW